MLKWNLSSKLNIIVSLNTVIGVSDLLQLRGIFFKLNVFFLYLFNILFEQFSKPNGTCVKIEFEREPDEQSQIRFDRFYKSNSLHCIIIFYFTIGSVHIIMKSIWMIWTKDKPFVI